jgi:hypothetical protein
MIFIYKKFIHLLHILLPFLVDSVCRIQVDTTIVEEHVAYNSLSMRMKS